MKKIASMVTSLLILMGTPALAGTSAQVEYGTVQESRILTQEATPQQGGARPLRTIGAAALGAAVGSQFGGGSGQTVATTVGGRGGGGGLPSPPGQPAECAGQADGRAVDQDRGGKTAQREAGSGSRAHVQQGGQGSHPDDGNGYPGRQVRLGAQPGGGMMPGRAPLPRPGCTMFHQGFHRLAKMRFRAGRTERLG